MDAARTWQSGRSLQNTVLKSREAVVTARFVTYADQHVRKRDKEAELDTFFLVASAILRWGAPLAGLVIMFLAWRRFESAGARLAAFGFAIMLISPVARQVMRAVIELDSFPDSRDIASRLITISVAAGAASLVGLALIIFAMRRLIADAEEAEKTLKETGE